MYEEDDEEVFLGMSAGSKKRHVSDETAHAIDEEVRHIIDDCYATAKRLIEENMDVLHNVTEALLEYETINADQIDDLMAGKKVRPPEDTRDDNHTDNHTDNHAAESKTDQGVRPSGPVGGPAGEH
jgi:cell division protease FtsH